MRQLAERYAVAVDGKDLDTLSGLFVPDVDNGHYGQGPDGVKAFFNEALQSFHCSMHLVANHIIDFDAEDRAHGIVYCRAQHHVLEPEHWYDMAMAYFDTYERDGERWYFRRRRAKAWYRQWFGYPDRGTERVRAGSQATGPLRGSTMPEAFETFEAFWTQSSSSGS
jgi:hypothetical protein